MAKPKPSTSVPADSDITVLRKYGKDDRRISVVAHPTGTYAVHTQSVHEDTSKVIKRGTGDGIDQVQAYHGRGYVAD
jgi:hypothetical protein